MCALGDTVSVQRGRTVRYREREREPQQLVTDAVGDVSSQFVLLIGGLAQFAHFKVYFSNTCNFLAAEDSAGAFWFERKVFAYGLSN